MKIVTVEHSADRVITTSQGFASLPQPLILVGDSVLISVGKAEEGGIDVNMTFSIPSASPSFSWKLAITLAWL